LTAIPQRGEEVTWSGDVQEVLGAEFRVEDVSD